MATWNPSHPSLPHWGQMQPDTSFCSAHYRQRILKGALLSRFPSLLFLFFLFVFCCNATIHLSALDQDV